MSTAEGGLQGAVIGQGKLFGAQAGVKPRGLQRGRDPGFGQAEAGRDGVGGRFSPLGKRRADQAEQAALVAVCGLYGRRIMQRQADDGARDLGFSLYLL